VSKAESEMLSKYLKLIFGEKWMEKYYVKNWISYSKKQTTHKTYKML
jgi:hypothetical protein